MNDQSTETAKRDSAQLEAKTATRERIVEAARDLFFKQGYVATGVAQILKESNANSGSLYYFFPSKEDLLVAVLEKYQALLEPRVLKPAFDRVAERKRAQSVSAIARNVKSSAQPKADDPIERLFAVLEGYRLLLEATNFDLGCPIGNLALEVSNSQPAARRLIIENFKAWCDAIRRLIEDAADRLPKDVEAPGLATHVLATMEGSVMLARAYRSFEPFDQAINQLKDYIGRLTRERTRRKRSRRR